MNGVLPAFPEQAHTVSAEVECERQWVGQDSLLFGANRGPRPSADGLASSTKMKTFWVIKYLNIYSTNK